MLGYEAVKSKREFTCEAPACFLGAFSGSFGQSELGVLAGINAYCSS